MRVCGRQQSFFSACYQRVPVMHTLLVPHRSHLFLRSSPSFWQSAPAASRRDLMHIPQYAACVYLFACFHDL